MAGPTPVDGVTADAGCVQHESGPTGGASASRLPLLLTLISLGLFATGVGPRPDGDVWATAYDLVLYNAVFAFGAIVCVAAALRAHADRLAWWPSRRT